MSEPVRFDVRAYIGRDEGQHFDRKSLFEGEPGDKRPRDRRKVRNHVAEYIAAFANAEGGVLLLGVEDGGEVTGHAYPADAVEGILSVPESRLEPPQPRGFVVEHDGHELLAFEVPMSPVPVMVLGDGYPYRMGDRTGVARFEQLEALKMSGVLGSFEAREAACDLDALDPELLARARRGAGLEALSDEEYLVRRRLADWRGPRFVLRQAAELLFHRDLPAHPNAGVRVFRVVGTERRTGIEHNVEELPRIEGALPRVIGETQSVIQALLRKPSRLTPGGRFRPTSEYPEFSWQEAVLNAIAHRDYAIEGRGVEVWLFDDRLEVTSPGGFMGVSLEEVLSLDRVHASRNPRLVRALVDLGAMRDQGEGIPRMFAEMSGNFLPQPELTATAREVRITLRNELTISERDRGLIDALAGEELSPDEFQALLEAHRAGRVDNARMRTLSGLDTLGASALLRGLRDRHLLRLHPAGGASYYTLGDELLRNFADGVGLDANGVGLGADRGELRADGVGFGTDGVGLDTDGVGLDTPAVSSNADTAAAGADPYVTDSERELIEALGIKPRKERVRRVIQTLARRRAWRPAELARVLGRKNVQKLTDTHLKVMVHDGLLRRTHPEQPSHPEQAYYAPKPNDDEEDA